MTQRIMCARIKYETHKLRNIRKLINLKNSLITIVQF